MNIRSITIALGMFIFSQAVFAQQADNVNLKNSPLVNGYTKADKTPDQPNSVHGINVYSANEKVLSVTSGVVSKVFMASNTGDMVVMIKSNDIFFVYSGLRNVKLKAGEAVSKETQIGEVLKVELNYVLNFAIWNTAKNTDKAIEEWSSERIIKYLNM